MELFITVIALCLCLPGFLFIRAVLNILALVMTKSLHVKKRRSTLWSKMRRASEALQFMAM